MMAAPPKIVCAGCGMEIPAYQVPVCTECRDFLVECGADLPKPCPHCYAGFALSNGMHVNQRGGHIGRCIA